MATNKNVIMSFLWKLSERGLSQVIAIVVQVVMARLLCPNDFGALAILLVFINIANVFIQKGFASSLIRKNDATVDDYNTAFTVSEIIAIICIFLIFAFSKHVAVFYNYASISLYLRVLSISLIFSSLYSIENAILVKQLKFKIIFLRSVVAVSLSGLVGIILAFNGFGVWALIVQNMVQQVLLCVTTYIGCNWKPQVMISKESFMQTFSFGSKVLIAELISIGVENIRTLIIGKKFSPVQLAFYDRGLFYPAAAMQGVYDTISSVMLPVLSQNQNNKEKMAEDVSNTISISSYIVFPAFIGFATVSPLFVRVILNEQWLPAVPFIIIFSIYELAFPIYGISRQALYALGRSDTVLRLELARSCFFLTAIIIGVQISTIATAILSLGALYLATCIYILKLRYYIPLDVKKIVISLLHTIVMCALMSCGLLLISKVNLGDFVLFVLEVILGVAVYIMLSVFTKHKALRTIVNGLRHKQ